MRKRKWEEGEEMRRYTFEKVAEYTGEDKTKEIAFK